MENNIKDYREKELKSYVIGNIILILVGLGFVESVVDNIGTENYWDAVGAIVSSGVISSLVYIYTYILDALIPGDVKDSIIWWKKGVPGNRVFSEIKQKNRDKRFTTQMILEKYEDVYKGIENKSGQEKKAIENSAWYSVYQRNEESALVFFSNKDWLLCRDLCVITIWVIVGSILTFLLFEEMLPCWLMGAFVFELIGTWIAARIKSKKFVYNVIAKDVQTNQRK